MCWWNRLRRVAFSLYVAQSPLNATPTCVGGSCPTKQVKTVVRCPPSFKSTQLSSSSCRWGWASPSRAIWLLYRFVSNCLRATLPSFRMMCILWPPPRPRFLQNNLNLPSSRKLLASGWTKAGISTRIRSKALVLSQFWVEDASRSHEAYWVARPAPNCWVGADLLMPGKF